ncbi:protein nutcracker [Episyrphus balteatus]|uniref:protein nutcracker n=1 Tax=Episyrphus balteatus TaxID=286459 RepID=UPI002485365F|nr:protein nutcracker [Episyrphus balteatus]
MDASNVQSQTAATSPSSPGAGNYNIPGNSSPKLDESKEDSKFKELEEDDHQTNTDLDMLTIEDSTLEKIPIHLANLLRSFDVEKSTPADLLIGLIYGIALECSFAAIDEVHQKHTSLQGVSKNQIASAFHSKHVRLLSNMPSGVYDANKMSYTLRLQLYLDPTETACLMTGVVTGDFLILTLTPDCGNAIGKSICLSIGRYVLNANGKPFPTRLRKLPELSYKLHEQVLVPVRKQLILGDDIVILYPSLEALPEELYIYLFGYLNRNNLNKTASVCKRLLSTVTRYQIYQRNKKMMKMKC